MAANVETMFCTRTKPWHGLGTVVGEALGAREALITAGLNWRVEPKEVYTEEGLYIPGYQANVRDMDQRVLGIVTDRYQILQNEEAFAFTEELLGEGVRYETAGSLQDGKRTWILAKMPEKYIIAGDAIEPYLVFMNSHDGSCSMKAAMTPIRVVCQNTLNMALRNAKRSWSTKHTTNMDSRLDDAKNTLLYAETYMNELGKGIEKLRQIRLSEHKVQEFINEFFPTTVDMSDSQIKNQMKLKNDLKLRYFEAPDLKDTGNNGYKLLNAVSDFATHAEPIRRTKNYKENLFVRTVEGNPLIDRAYQMIQAA